MLNRRLHKDSEVEIQQSSGLNNSRLQHLKTCDLGIRQQVVDAIGAETGLISQEGFPLFTWEMRLQPENPMDAVHSKLEQTGPIQGLSDQIQENVNEVNLLCRNTPKRIVRADTKSTECCQRFHRMPNRKRW